MSFWAGEKIQLRAIEPADAQAVLAWHEDSEVSRHMDFLNPPQSLESVKAFIEKETRNTLKNDQYFWVIEDKQGQVAGHIDTRCDRRHGNFEYGVSVSASHRRSGYASEAILMVLDYYFHHLRYHKANAGVHSDNESSRQLHEKLGFTLEGTLRDMVFTNGAYVDMLRYGITASEFARQRR